MRPRRPGGARGGRASSLRTLLFNGPQTRRRVERASVDEERFQLPEDRLLFADRLRVVETDGADHLASMEVDGTHHGLGKSAARRDGAEVGEPGCNEGAERPGDRKQGRPERLVLLALIADQ